EGREVVHGAEPLVVDIFMATLARLRFHEKVSRNQLAIDGLCGTRKERTTRAISFGVHRGWRRAVDDHVRAKPAYFAPLIACKGYESESCEQGRSGNEDVQSCETW